MSEAELTTEGIKPARMLPLKFGVLKCVPAGREQGNFGPGIECVSAKARFVPVLLEGGGEADASACAHFSGNIF